MTLRNTTYHVLRCTDSSNNVVLDEICFVIGVGCHVPHAS